MPHPFFDVERPVVIGHRGSAGTHPENTLTSFEAALEQGAQILESDVHLTRDGVPVLLHDPGLGRVTEREAQVADLNWSEVASLDAGYHFVDPDGRAVHRGQGHRIPSVEEAFARFPDARFNLEIKSHDPSAIRALLDLIATQGRADRTLVAAGEDPIMKELRAVLAADPVQPAVGASLGEILASIRSALGEGPMPEGVMALQIPAEFAGQPLATPRFVAHAHAHGVEVHVWTINDLAEIDALLGLGVDGIVTDLPGRMSAWLRRDGRN